MRYSDWQYISYVLLAMGVSFALSGGISLYSLQQGLLLNTQYASSFLAIFAFGILVIFPGVAILIFANKKKSSINLPPPPDFLEVPPPP